MSDPDAETEDEFKDHLDYYSVLNVRKDATDSEIKAAFRRMCVMYHPDKHQNSKKKVVAERVFARVNKAHEVLSKAHTRMIYDLYGQKGLDAGWEVIERTRTPKEIQEEYERLQKEAEERRIELRTNPKGSVTVNIDATDIFRSNEINHDPYYQDETSFLPNIEIQGMSINQSIEAPLTKKNTAILSGSLSHRNGNGTGTVNVNVRRVISHQSWGEMEVGVGDVPSVRLKGFRNLGKKMFGTLSLTSTVKQHRLTAGLQAMVARQLAKNTMGYLTWSGGMMSSMTTTLVHSKEKYHFMAQLQLGIPHSFGVLSYTYKFDSDSKVKLACRYGVLGFVFEYGYEHKITSLSRLGATMSVGHNTGVTLKIKLHRHTQSFNFPILLCQELLPSAVFYGTVVPVVTYVTVRALILAPIYRKQREEQAEELQKKYASVIEEKRRQAVQEINLMMDVYKRNVEEEEEKHGLLITEAWYGRINVNNNHDSVTDFPSKSIADVKVPLQCMVKDSKLIITDATKAHLNGFYDPCLSEDKYLKIIYEFRDALHEHTYKDHEQVRIPVKSHKISSKVS